MDKLIIERIWAMPNKNTFSILPIRNLILEEKYKTKGTWIDPFANTSTFADITNDLDPSMPTDYHMEAMDFLRMFDDCSVDGVLYDPPFSPRQVKECYNKLNKTVSWMTTSCRYWSAQKDEIARILKPGGKVITCGWNSDGLGINRGFRLERVLLVPHGGHKNDTIVTVETKKVARKTLL